MDVPEFDMQVLQFIASSKYGVPQSDLVSKFGDEVSATLQFLLDNNLARVHFMDLKPFMPPCNGYYDPPKGNVLATDLGKVEVKRKKTRDYLPTRQKWKERAIGAGGTMLIWALQEIITRFLIS